jgi:hypothetical protein
MNRIRKWTCLLLTSAALAAFILPSHGYAAQSQNKTYILTMCVGNWKADGSCDPSAPSNGTDPTVVRARLTNTSPKQSSSTFGSVDLFANLHWTINSVDSVYLTSLGDTIQFLSFTNWSDGHIRIENLSPVKPGDSLNVTFSVTNFSCGDGSWSQSLIWSGSNFGGNTFTMEAPPKSAPVTSVACGSVSCAADVLVQPYSTYCAETSQEGVECVSGMRGPDNKNGSACSSLPTYISTFSPTTSQPKVHWRWPNDGTTTVSTAVFTYTINTPNPGPADVAWLEDANGPIAVPALSCETTPSFLQSPLPQVLGTLAADVNSSKKQLKVTAPSTVTAPPAFTIVIGFEMMRVTNISSGNWTVVRGWGNTTPAPHNVTDTLNKIMYSPLPIIQDVAPFNSAAFANTLYAPGNHAHMCYTLTGPNTTGTYFTEIIDIGDGWTLGR